MGKRIVYIRVRANLLLNGFSMEADGSATHELLNKIHEAEEKFREAIITFINDAINPDSWSLRFAERWEDEKIDVHVYCNDEDYETIINIVRERLPQFTFNFYNRGDISEYIQTPQ